MLLLEEMLYEEIVITWRAKRAKKTKTQTLAYILQDYFSTDALESTLTFILEERPRGTHKNNLIFLSAALINAGCCVSFGDHELVLRYWSD